MEETYIEPTKDETEMAFVASCIEDVASRLRLPYINVIEQINSYRYQ